MVRFVNVTKEYENKNITTALRNINFNVDEGEFVFLIGPSGAGKSTIINLLIRAETPSEGEIFFNDIEVTSMKKKGLPYLRREIGVVFQDYKLLPHKNVYENVAFVLEVSGAKGKDVKQVTNHVIELVGLTDKRDHFPDQLSGGEKQRVAIARAVANEPQLLVADEPTGNLDIESDKRNS